MDYFSLCIIDKNHLNLQEYRKYLNSCFAVCAEFSTAEDCLKNTAKFSLDIILANIDLLRSGTITNILKAYPRAKIAVILDKFDEKKILPLVREGVRAFVYKNDLQKLSEILKTVHSGGFWMNFKNARELFFKLMVRENKSSFESLTKRELEALKLLALGKTNSQIASEMIVSINTAKAHVGSIFEKLCVTDRVQAAVKAAKANLL